MNATDYVISKSSELAILGNKDFEGNRGVLFNERRSLLGDRITEAYIVSSVAIVEFSGPQFDFPIDRPFFNYNTGEWSRETTTFGDKDGALRCKELISGYKFHETIRVPVSNVLNTIAYELPEERSRNRSRTIIKANDGQIFLGEIILLFKDGMFVNEKFPGVIFVPVKESIFNCEPIDGRMYVASPIEGEEIRTPNGIEVLVNLKRKYFKGIEFGVHELVDVGTYFPESETEIIDFSYYSDNRVVQVPFILPVPINSYSFKPIHVETPTLYRILKLMVDYEYVDISVYDRVGVIKLSGINGPKDVPNIDAYFGTLNPEFRGYYL